MFAVYAKMPSWKVSAGRVLRRVTYVRISPVREDIEALYKFKAVLESEGFEFPMMVRGYTPET